MVAQKSKKWESIGIEVHLLRKIDILVNQGVFANRQQAANYMVRIYLENLKTVQDLQKESERLKAELKKFETEEV